MQIFVLIHRLHRCSDFRPIVYPRGVIQTRIDATVAHSISEIVVPVRVVDVDVRKDVEIIFHVWQKNNCWDYSVRSSTDSPFSESFLHRCFRDWRRVVANAA